MKRVLSSLALMLCGSFVCFSQTIAETDSVKARVESEQPSVVDPQPSTANISVGQRTQESPMVNGQRSMFNGQWIGFLSYDSALVAMPEYAIVQHRMNETRKAYDAELQRVENEFNSKYEEFLENQKDFPRTILLKRQNELQELMERNIAFKNESRRDLRVQEKELMAPLRKRLNEVIAVMAKTKGLVMVVNTDSEACPFIDPSMSVDLNKEVQLQLNK